MGTILRRIAAAAIGATVSMAAMPATAAQLRLAIGGDDDLRDALRGASLLVQTITEDADAPRREIVAAAQADYRRLVSALFERGHFGPVVSITVDGTEADRLPLIGTGAPVNVVRVEVLPGPRFRFGDMRIGPLARDTDIPEGFERGEPAGTDVLRDAATAAVTAWRADGHAKAELASQDIVADHAANRLDATLAIAPGPRLRFGSTIVEGEARVRENHIRRIADLDRGAVFDPDEVEAAARRLQRTGAFRSVSVQEADVIGPDDTLPMTVEVIERLPRRFGFGAEVGSTEGVGLSAFWLHRNLTGYADSLRVEGEVSGIGGDSGGADYRLGVDYVRPATFNPETDLVIGTELSRLDQPDFLSDRFTVGVGARRIVSDEFQIDYGIAYLFSKTEDAFGEREFSILSAPVNATYDRRDDPLNPADGYYVEAGLEPFQGLQTAGTGLRFDADLRGYQGFGAERGTVLAARIQLRSVFGPDREDIPPEWLFFSGGGGTVRGQPFQDLAVEIDADDDGELDRVGGKSFLGLSAELRQAVTGNIGLVGFADVGFVSPEADFTGGESHAGAGLGIRYNTGIGPIRLDVGVPVSGPNDDGGVEVYIGIGQAF